MPEGHRVQCADDGAQEPAQVDSPATEAQDEATAKPGIQTVPPSLDTIYRGDPNSVIFPSGLCEAERNKLQRWSDIAYKIEEQVPHPTLGASGLRCGPHRHVDSCKSARFL